MTTTEKKPKYAPLFTQHAFNPEVLAKFIAAGLNSARRPDEPEYRAEPSDVALPYTIRWYVREPQYPRWCGAATGTAAAAFSVEQARGAANVSPCVIYLLLPAERYSDRIHSQRLKLRADGTLDFPHLHERIAARRAFLTAQLETQRKAEVKREAALNNVKALFSVRGAKQEYGGLGSGTKYTMPSGLVFEVTTGDDGEVWLRGVRPPNFNRLTGEQLEILVDRYERFTDTLEALFAQGGES